MAFNMDNAKLIHAICQSIQKLETQFSESRILRFLHPQQSRRMERMRNDGWYHHAQFFDPLTTILMIRRILVDTPHSQLAMLLHEAIGNQKVFNENCKPFQTGDEVSRIAHNNHGIGNAFITVYGQICNSLIQDLIQEGYHRDSSDYKTEIYLGFEERPALDARNRRASMGVR